MGEISKITFIGEHEKKHEDAIIETLMAYKTAKKDDPKPTIISIFFQ